MLKNTSIMSLITIIFVLLLISQVIGLCWFVLSSELSSFSSDSANYLFIARYFSEYGSLNEAYHTVYSTQVFPPFFPLLLIFSGSYDSIWQAHLLVLLHLFSFYILLFYYCKKYGAGNYLLYTVTILAMFIPGVWIGSLGVLSENIFVFYVLLLTYVWQHHVVKLQKNNTSTIVALTLLLSIIPLIRTIGIVVVLAYLICSYKRFKDNQISLSYVIYPSAISIAIYLLWGIIGPQHSQGYFSVMISLAESTFSGNGLSISTVLYSNLISFYYQWLEFFGVFKDDFYLKIFPILWLLLILICLYYQATRYSLLGLILLLYIFSVIAWPIAIDHWYRFILPFFLLSLAVFVEFIVDHNIYDIRLLKTFSRNKNVYRFITNSAVSLFVFFQLFILIDYIIENKSKDERVANITELYRLGEKRLSYETAKNTRELLDDYKTFNSLNTKDVLVYAVKPTFLTYLSNIPATKLYGIRQKGDICQFRNTGNSYVLVSNLNASYNRDGVGILRHLGLFSNLVSYTPNNVKSDKKTPRSLLFKIDNEKLKSLVQDNNFDCRNWKAPN